ncbi:recombinase family protein [Citricoccus sp. NR2]|uniref:recombinase family protein n=1 Tax=Citricoccus sp. NR2 TaxID=3004095 RepID=UPI0022DDDE05|nr:recombinase family protein [Citricoccus sp. NR2]WBL20244.1 recombinase family protein [Citricoccus sp. NR2]
MAPLSLARVSSAKQTTQVQHDAFNSICAGVFQKRTSSKLAVEYRLGPKTAIAYKPNSEMTAVEKGDRLGFNQPEGLLTLDEPFHRVGNAKIIHVLAAGTHTKRRFLLDAALAEQRRRNIARKPKNSLNGMNAPKDVKHGH